MLNSQSHSQLQLREIGLNELSNSLRERTENGYRFEPRIQQMIRHSIDHSNSLRTGSLHSRESYLALLWHAIPDCRALTPSGEARNLRAVIERVREKGWNIERLGTDDRLDPDGYFAQCLSIIRGGYDHGKMHYLLLRRLHEKELRDHTEFHGSVYYILDGCHRSFVYAYLLLVENIDYEPVNCILVDLPYGYDEHRPETWPNPRD